MVYALVSVRLKLLHFTENITEYALKMQNSKQKWPTEIWNEDSESFSVRQTALYNHLCWNKTEKPMWSSESCYPINSHPFQSTWTVQNWSCTESQKQQQLSCNEHQQISVWSLWSLERQGSVHTWQNWLD